MSAPSAGPGAGAPARRPFARLAVTLAAPILVGLAARIPLPGVDARRDLGVLGLGLGPVVWASVLVELAALVVPAWRPLRVGGPAGRATLATAAIWLGLVLAAIQAWSVVPGALPETTLPRNLPVLTLIAGTAALAWVASIAGRYGLANGYATLLAADALGSTFATVTGEVTLAGATSGFGWTIALAFHLLVPILVAAIVVGALLGNERAPPGGAAWPRLRDPASGLVPLSTADIIFIPATLSGLFPALGGALYHGLRFAVAVPLASLFAGLFNRPRKVAEVWGRLPDAPPGAADREARASARVRMARIRAAALVGLVVLAGALVAGTLLSFVIGSLAFGAAAVADALGEWRARRIWPDLVSVWPEPRLYAADAGLAALSDAGIPSFARGAHYRTLGQFFAPYVPAEILVPAGRAAEAEVILRRVLVGEGAPAKL